jgi:hypothetical protein
MPPTDAGEPSSANPSQEDQTMSNKAASNVIAMREFDRTTADPNAAQFDRLLNECQKLAQDRLSLSVAAMLDKAEEALWALADQTVDREMRNVYITAKDAALGQRKTIEDQFRKNYLAEFERRAKRETKRDEFSQYDLSSLELGLVNDEDLEETLKVNDMAAKLRRYCEEELNALDQRVGVLIGDANLQADGNPFSPQAVCNAYKQTCRGFESNMKIRMIFHKLFDDHVLDDVRSIYKDINALLIQRSILPKIRFGVRRGAGAIGRRPGVPAMPAAADLSGANVGVAAGVNPMAMGMPVGGIMSADGGGAGYGSDAGGGEQDLFSVLQSLLARSVPGMGSAAVGGVPGGGMPSAMAGSAPGGIVQIPGFPPILGASVDGILPGATSASMAGGMTGGSPLPQRFLQGAELIGSLTRLQHGDVAAMPAGMPPIDLAALMSGTTNVVRELKSSGLGNQVDQTDGVTIDIVAMLFDQIFGDPRVPEALKALIGRLQIPVVKVAVLDKKFFSKKAHPARRMLDTLGEFALGLDETFDATSPLYKHIEGIIARLLDQFIDDVEVFETLHNELLEVIRGENKRAEDSAKEMARKIAYKERLEVGKAIAQLEIKNRAQASRLPQLVQRFLTDEWVKLLLLTYARHGQEGDAWKSALDTMDHLVWSVTFKPSVDDRRKLAHLLPGLLKRLQAGLQSTGTAEDKRKQFFTKLMRLHTKAMTVPKAAPQPTEVPTLSEVVTPAPLASEATQQAKAPAPVSAPADRPAPATPPFDFDLLPAADDRAATQTQKPGVAEHVVATAMLPVMTPPEPAAAAAAAPVEAEDEGEASSALEFSNVTIKNPFGDGDIEVEEISLSDLPGFAPAASNDAAAGTGDQYSQTVKKFKTGDWLEFRESDEHRLQAKLSYISPLKGTYLFVNRHGERVGEYSLFQLAQEMRAGRAVVLEDVPLIDRAMSSLVGALKKNSR